MRRRVTFAFVERLHIDYVFEKGNDKRQIVRQHPHIPDVSMCFDLQGKVTKEVELCIRNVETKSHSVLKGPHD